MDRTEPRSHRPAGLPDSVVALVAAPLDPQTYRNLSYLILSVPLALAYLVFLALGFGLVPGALSGTAWWLAGGGPLALVGAALCLAAGLVTLPAMLPVLNAVPRLAAFEHRLIGRLLGDAWGWGAAGATVTSGRGPWRSLGARLRDVGVARGLTYLLVKAPFALLGCAVVAAATALIALLLLAPALATTATFSGLYAAAGIGSGGDAWLCVLVAFPVLGFAVQAVNALAWVARELARLLLAPADAARYEWAVRSTTR